MNENKKINWFFWFIWFIGMMNMVLGVVCLITDQVYGGTPFLVIGGFILTFLLIDYEITKLSEVKQK